MEVHIARNGYRTDNDKEPDRFDFVAYPDITVSESLTVSESVHAEENSTADYIPVIPVIPADTTREPAEETEPEILTQYASMYEQNPDLFG